MRAVGIPAKLRASVNSVDRALDVFERNGICITACVGAVYLQRLHTFQTRHLCCITARRLAV